jgi:poly [ADP-ribose] polymerase 2/3/4
MGKVIKLIMVTETNSNKFYTMTENDNGTFTANWGRVGASGDSQVKPMSHWDKVYKEKTKKGYKDQTDLFVVETVVAKPEEKKEFRDDRSSFVVRLVKKLQSWAKGSIAENYTVSSEQVTQKQVDAAQALLDKIVQYDLSAKNIPEFNKLLLDLYAVVPRKMKHIKLHLVNTDSDLKVQKNKIITEEQATLDVMAGQVKLNENMKQTESETKTDDEETPKVMADIISASGLDIVEVTDKTVIERIKKLMGSESGKFKEAYEVKNIKTQTMYDGQIQSASNKKEELFWHGSRNENWWSIMTTGLLIRPSNAVHSGSMFGDGIYFADKFKKSYGYTSGRYSYWAKGNSDEAVLALYSVHVGEQKIIKKHNSDCYKLSHKVLSKDGYDSVFAQGGIDLINNEYIVYQSQQSTIKYLVIVNS